MLKKTKSQSPTVPDNGEGPVDAALMARICWHYFKEGQSQDAIAQSTKEVQREPRWMRGPIQKLMR